MPILDKGLEVFANWQTLMLGLSIYVMSFGTRRVVETGWVGAKKNKWWTEVLLPMTPIGCGVLLAFIAQQFPWPLPVNGSFSARAMYGVFCGMSCGWLYSRVRGYVNAGKAEKAEKSGMEKPPSIPPPSEPKSEEPVPAQPEEPKSEAGETLKP